MCAIEIERIKSKINTSSEAPSPITPTPQSHPPVSYFDQQQQQHHSSHPTPLYQSTTKIDEPHTNNELLFPPWATNTSYTSQYYDGQGTSLPEITAISKSSVQHNHQHQQTFAKLAELAGGDVTGSTDALGSYTGGFTVAPMEQLTSYGARYDSEGRMRAGSDTSSLKDGGTPAAKTNSEEMVMPRQATAPPPAPQPPSSLYDPSSAAAAAATITSYEQAAVSNTFINCL